MYRRAPRVSGTAPGSASPAFHFRHLDFGPVAVFSHMAPFLILRHLESVHGFMSPRFVSEAVQDTKTHDVNISAKLRLGFRFSRMLMDFDRSKCLIIFFESQICTPSRCKLLEVTAKAVGTAIEEWKREAGYYILNPSSWYSLQFSNQINDRLCWNMPCVMGCGICWSASHQSGLPGQIVDLLLCEFRKSIRRNTSQYRGSILFLGASVK